MQTSQKIKIKRIVIGIICVVLFLGAFFGALSLYQGNRTQRVADFSFGDDKQANRMNVSMVVTGIDPIKGELSVRVSTDPEGTYGAPDGGNLMSKELKFYVNVEGGKSETILPKNRIPDSANGVFSFYEGRPTDYPFDIHTADAYLFFTDPKKETEEIPMSVQFYGAISGYNIDADYIPNTEFASSDAYIGLRIKVSRSIITKIFAMYIIVTVWLVALAVFLMALTVLLQPRPVELAMFIFPSTMLFVIPGTRALLPTGAPPVGSLIDFLCYFWAQGFDTLALVIIFFCWLTRYRKPT